MLVDRPTLVARTKIERRPNLLRAPLQYFWSRCESSMANIEKKSINWRFDKWIAPSFCTFWVPDELVGSELMCATFQLLADHIFILFHNWPRFWNNGNAFENTIVARDNLLGGPLFDPLVGILNILDLISCGFIFVKN